MFPQQSKDILRF